MAATLVGTAIAGVNYGIALAEAGLMIQKVEVTFSNPRDELKNNAGATVGFATNFDPSLTIAISGEINAATGHSAATFIAAGTIANTITGHGITAGGAYLTDAKETSTRDGFRMGDYTYKANPLVA